MPGEPFTPALDKNGKPNAVLTALERGYVVAAPGARGRSSKDANGKFSEKGTTQRQHSGFPSGKSSVEPDEEDVRNQH